MLLASLSGFKTWGGCGRGTVPLFTNSILACWVSTRHALKQACMAYKDGFPHLQTQCSHHEFQSFVCFETIHML